MEHLILIGYRGTGKTSAAAELGKKIGRKVIDTDPLIEQHAGKTIAEIFAQDGETVFRNLEAAVLADVLQASDEPLVAATGGGAVLREENRTILKSTGFIVWLTAEPETILRRIQGDAASTTMRPNLTALTPLEEIITVLERRETFYRQTADAVVKTDGKTVGEIAAEIIGLCRSETYRFKTHNP